MNKRQRNRARRHHTAHALKAMEPILRMVAPAIEAAGSLDRAMAIGVLNIGDEDDVERLRFVVPVSRGGHLPDAEAQWHWQRAVKQAIQERGIDLAKMREVFAQMQDSSI